MKIQTTLELPKHIAEENIIKQGNLVVGLVSGNVYRIIKLNQNGTFDGIIEYAREHSDLQGKISLFVGNKAVKQFIGKIIIEVKE